MGVEPNKIPFQQKNESTFGYDEYCQKVVIYSYLLARRIQGNIPLSSSPFLNEIQTITQAHQLQ